MELKHIRYFVEVAEQKSMRKAAAELYVTQPSLSRTIQAMEVELGAQLLVRSNHGVILTETGETAYYYAKTILDQMECFDRLKQQAGFQVEAKLGISVARVILKDTLMLDYRNKINATHFNVKILETGVESALEEVAAMKPDIGLVMVNSWQYPVLCKVAEIRDLEVHKIRCSRLYVHMNASNPLMQKENVTLDDLQDYSQIHLPPDYFSNLNFGVKLGSSKLKNIRKTIIMNNYHSILCMLKHSESFLFGGEWQIEELGHGGIESRVVNEFDGKMCLVWFKRKRETLSECADIFLKMLLDNYTIPENNSPESSDRNHM